jgi:hypothetical protein
MSTSMPEPGAVDRGDVVEYHFPVVVEIRESPAADDREIAERVMRKLLAELGR